MNDEMLISTDIQGNNKLDTLLARRRRLLHSLALRILRSHEEADDAVQNCLVLASRNLPQCERQSALQ
jgi:DNA-directed RNA polymerase specialized sigma24 family protein